MGEQKEAVKMAIKDELLGRFRAGNAKAGDTLSPQWLHNDYLPTLSAKEEQALEEVIAEMISEGIIEYVGGAKPTYKLTKKGEEMLC